MMDDLIRRQDAIDALLAEIEQRENYEDSFIYDTLDKYDIKAILNRIPSAQQWIPCSERLPEEDEDVLVWYEYFRYGDYNCLYQTYGIGYCSIVDSKVIWGGDVSGHRARAIAWMPLPEPWKGEGET